MARSDSSLLLLSVISSNIKSIYIHFLVYLSMIKTYLYNSWTQIFKYK